MKDFRFYAVLQEERTGKHATKKHNAFTRATMKQAIAFGQSCECLALDISDSRWRYNPFAASCVLSYNLDAIAFSGVSLDYLATRCVRISESMARALHPQLFRYLDD